jgi:putative sterol carrier protein
MAESAREFFESVSGRIDPASTAGRRASYRFDVTGAGSWRVAVDDGTVAVEETDADADCVIQLSEETFQKLRAGQANPMTAFMTGKIKVKGDLALATKLKELFF